MSSWNNWRWERNMQKVHSSVRNKGKGQGKKTITTTTMHFHWPFKVVPMVSLGITFWLIGVSLPFIVLFVFLYSFMFNFEAHQTQKVTKQ